MRRTVSGLLTTLLALAALAPAGCFVDELTPPPPATTTTTMMHAETSLAAGDYAIQVDPKTRDLQLVRGSTVLLDLPAAALELGVLPALDDTVNYDPTSLVIPSALHPPPDGLVWQAPESVAVATSDATHISLLLTYAAGKTATLVVTTPEAGSFTLTLTPDATSPGAVAYFRIAPRADATEGFYGLGETYDAVNHRGKVRPMQIEIDGTYESGYNNAHVPIPFVIGTRGWGFFVECPYPGVFAVATDAENRVEATFGTGLASTKGIVFHLFGEEKPIDITRHYYDLTGYPRLPARWALGPWVWRDEVKDQAQAAGDLQTMRDLDLAGTAYWLDRPYATAVETFDFDPAKFTDAPAFIQGAHDLGFGIAIWHSPYLDTKSAATAALRAQATAMGYYPPVAGVPLNGWGTLLDLTNTGAYTWWQGLLGAYTAVGVEGYKLDYGEDVVPGLTSGRNVWEFADGSDERTMSSGFTRFYHSVYQGTLPENGSFLLCRHGVYGDQLNVSVIWPGDLDASFAKNGDPVPGQSGTSYVGGFPAALIAGLGLGPSGFPFFGADTGGYIHSPPNKELYARWCEQTALSTVMQSGNAASTVPWEPDPTTGYDDELLGWYRTYGRLHLRLFPYVWTYAENIAHDGRAIARPLGLAYPELGQHPDDIYMFGDSILVAPVTEPGVTSRSVLLPAGDWLDWWTGAVVHGGGTIMADAPLGTLPLYLAAGGIVPMLRPTIDTMRPVLDPTTVDSYGTTPGILWARVAPSSFAASSSFTVFDGTTLSQAQTAGGLTLGATGGEEFTQGVMFEVIGVAKMPSQVTDGAAILSRRASVAALTTAGAGWAYTGDTGGTVWVLTGGGTHAITVLP